MSSKSRGRIRELVIFNALQSCISSKLCHLLIILWISCRIIFTWSGRLRYLGYLLTLISATYFVIFLKHIIFEVVVTYHAMASMCNAFEWFTLVDDNLYLGGTIVLCRLFTLYSVLPESNYILFHVTLLCAL